MHSYRSTRVSVQPQHLLTQQTAIPPERTAEDLEERYRGGNVDDLIGTSIG